MNRRVRAILGKAFRLARELRYMVAGDPVPKETFDLSTLPAAARFFDEHGWVLLKRVFSAEEIEQFRRDVVASRLAGDRGDLLSNPRLSRVVLDDRLIDLARGLLGDQPTYYGDSSWYSSETHPFDLGFHKDNADKFNASGPDWAAKYPLVRMAIYLQDHESFSGGVALRDRSHHTTDCGVGQPFAAPTAKGDVVVWSFRTSHSGLASRPRLFSNLFVPLTVQNLLTVRRRPGEKPKFRPPPLLFRPMEHPERLALFVSLGVDGSTLRRYVEYLKTRRFAVVLWQQCVYTDALRAAARDKGLGFVDVPAQVAHRDPMSASEEHRDPPADMPVPMAEPAAPPAST
jgi:hypothetical protein